MLIVLSLSSLSGFVYSFLSQFCSIIHLHPTNLHMWVKGDRIRNILVKNKGKLKNWGTSNESKQVQSIIKIIIFVARQPSTPSPLSTTRVICNFFLIYSKDTEPLCHSLYVLTCIASLQYLSIPCNTFIACYINISIINYLPRCIYFRISLLYFWPMFYAAMIFPLQICHS